MLLRVHDQNNYLYNGRAGWRVGKSLALEGDYYY